MCGSAEGTLPEKFDTVRAQCRHEDSSSGGDHKKAEKLVHEQHRMSEEEPSAFCCHHRPSCTATKLGQAKGQTATGGNNKTMKLLSNAITT